MDVSEYEAMKEKEMLLKDSLKKERDLQKVIDTLTKEKLQALETAKMKVIKVKRVERRDFIIPKRVDSSRVLRDLFITIGVNVPRERSFPSFEYGNIDIDRLRDAFFEHGSTHSYPEIEETTVHGLDEVTAEIKEDLKNSMDEQTKEKLKLAEEILEKNEKLVNGNSSLMKENRRLEESNKRFSKLIDTLSIEDKDKDDKVRRFEEMKAILQLGYSTFGKGRILNDLTRIAFEKKD